MPDCLTLGGGSHYDNTNVIEVSTDVTIEEVQLSRDQTNIILIMVAGVTVTLPRDDPERMVIVQQGFDGVGTYTIN